MAGPLEKRGRAGIFVMVGLMKKGEGPPVRIMEVNVQRGKVSERKTVNPEKSRYYRNDRLPRLIN